MKRWALLCGLVCVLVWPIGCSRQAEEETPTAYDPNIDGPANMVTIHADPNLLADQGELSKRAERATAAEATPAMPETTPEETTKPETPAIPAPG